MIRKIESGYKVVSHQTGKSFGTYATREEAERRLRQMQAHKGKAQPAGKTAYRRAQHPNN